MKFSPTMYKPDSSAVNNGDPTESSHALAVDEYSTFMASAFKFSSPATCVNPMSEIVGTGYTDKGWGRFMLWVPPFTRYIGFEFFAMGSGLVTVSTPNDSTDDYLIQVKVDSVGWIELETSGEWDITSSGGPPPGKGGWLLQLYGPHGGQSGNWDIIHNAGQLYQSGPPMPNPNAHNKNRAIICPFKRFPQELEVHVKVENESDDKIGIAVWPFKFFYYTPSAQEDLTTAGAS
tara:strand:+ start:1318 stop:2016 length:699 start_codon:yes stop_codon:yes gene_type:complete